MKELIVKEYLFEGFEEALSDIIGNVSVYGNGSGKASGYGDCYGGGDGAGDCCGKFFHASGGCGMEDGSGMGCGDADGGSQKGENRMEKMNTQKLMYYLCIALLAIIAGAVTGVILIPVAYAERGYFAVGGEWILIIAAAVLAVKYFQGKEEKYEIRNYRYCDGLSWTRAPQNKGA